MRNAEKDSVGAVFQKEETVRYVSIWTNKEGGEFLVSLRVVPAGREGKTVYGRTLRHGEEVDPDEGVLVRAGERFVFREGDLTIDARAVDELYNPEERGGYRPISNTVWTWHHFTSERRSFFLFIFALAKRLDATHTSWVAALEIRDRAREEKGISRRRLHLSELAAAEATVVPLGRCYSMIRTLVRQHCPELHMPETVARTFGAVCEMRNAFEHIDERAEGKLKVGRKTVIDPDAFTIFDQPDFIGSGILRYKAFQLNFESDVLAALIECRGLVLAAIRARVRARARLD
ncbi:MAG: hypothetical protein OXU75_00860 [Deltaproteobacteria bacterium]|nr:hypothetical protein [Deltaproteobacteria bacterium]